MFIIHVYKNEKIFFPELLWLYRSWIEIMINEPKQWRTDLIIFTDQMTNNLKKLNCLFGKVRQNESEYPQCRVFQYQSILNRHSFIHLNRSIDIERSNLLYKHLRNYSYIDSINVISEGYPIYSQYNSVLRTDLDVFITKYFSNYPPFLNETLFVGLGGYVTEFNRNRLRRIANDINWKYSNLSAIGSTWYVLFYE